MQNFTAPSTLTLSIDRKTLRSAIASMDAASATGSTDRTNKMPVYVDVIHADGIVHLDMPGRLSIEIHRRDEVHFPAVSALVELKALKSAVAASKGKTVDLILGLSVSPTLGLILGLSVGPIPIQTVQDPEARETVLRRQNNWTHAPTFLDADRLTNKSMVNRLQIPFGDFHRALVLTAASIGDGGRYSTSGLELAKKDDREHFTLMTTDGRRLTASGSKDCMVKPEAEIEKVPLPNWVLETLKSWTVPADDTLTVQIHQDPDADKRSLWDCPMVFRTATHRLTVKIPALNLPDWRMVIPSQVGTKIVLDCETLEQTIAGLKPIWSEGELSIVTLAKNEETGGLIVSASAGGLSASAEIKPSAPMGDFPPFALNPRFMADLTVPKSLRTRPVDVTLTVVDDSMPVRASSDFTPDTKKVLMPVSAK